MWPGSSCYCVIYAILDIFASFEWLCCLKMMPVRGWRVWHWSHLHWCWIETKLTILSLICKEIYIYFLWLFNSQPSPLHSPIYLARPLLHLTDSHTDPSFGFHLSAVLRPVYFPHPVFFSPHQIKPCHRKSEKERLIDGLEGCCNVILWSHCWVLSHEYGMCICAHARAVTCYTPDW